MNLNQLTCITTLRLSATNMPHNSGISSSYGESVSSVTIKQRIKKIIEAEDVRKPLSDSKIVSMLQKEGLILARRTIAKYREELKISTSNQRKMLY